MLEHPYGWLSLMPPVVAIALAIVTRRAAISLVAGVLFGALVTTHGDLLQAIYDTLEVHLWPTLTDPGKLRVFCFTLLMGAMIGVICRSGGMQGLIRLVSPWANSRRSGQLATWVLGLLIFFDDYANTILLGNTLRPICDRLRISREKLAYLVDSTAAPVAGLALVSTWVAVEIDYLRDGIDLLPAGSGLQAFDLFIASIPYRFYVLMSLLFIPMVALLGRDFGPMLAAERRRFLDPREFGEGEQELLDSSNDERTVPARWFNAVLPVLVTLGVTMVLLYVTGRNALAEEGLVADPRLRDILGKAASSFSLFYGSMAGLVLAGLLARVQGILSIREVMAAAGSGARIVLPAIAILWCASTMSRMTGNKSAEGDPTTTPYEFKQHRLYTGDYLAQILVPENGDASTESGEVQAVIPIQLLPTVVFVLASIVAFCTGTSYGTMGILLPMVISITHTMLTAGGQTLSPDDPILLATAGGVLAGAIFGDHCSPISDTTILSSQSCGCDHMVHVVTQMPYALTVAFVAIVLGTLPLGWGVSVWLLLPAQAVALFVILMLLGKKVEAA